MKFYDVLNCSNVFLFLFAITPPPQPPENVLKLKFKFLKPFKNEYESKFNRIHFEGLVTKWSKDIFFKFISRWCPHTPFQPQF